MYLQNKYTRWYYNIIQRAQQRNISGYTEKHHIIPRSFGGSNQKENLVALTAREHFVCHFC
jgi:5-methylcytosine-specific restriction endonuclease McrA